MFEAQAEGWEPLSYQWFRNNRLIAGGNNKKLTIKNIKQKDYGDYFVPWSKIWWVKQHLKPWY